MSIRLTSNMLRLNNPIYLSPSCQTLILAGGELICTSWDSALGAVNHGENPETNDGEGYF